MPSRAAAAVTLPSVATASNTCICRIVTFTYPPLQFECGGIVSMKAVERVKGIEPSYSAWEAAALPLSYTRTALDGHRWAALSGKSGAIATIVWGGSTYDRP